MTTSGDAWAVIGSRSGRFGLLHGDAAATGALSIAASVGAKPVAIGHLLVNERPNGWASPELYLRGARVLTDLDILFWPDLPVDPLRLLRTLARHAPLVAVWPGEIAEDRVGYSEPGRRDHYDQPIPSEAIVLRARTNTFPDELPYEVERI